MRDHRRLKAFELADRLALDVYAATRDFPREETYALSQQLRRAAVSVISNIVEGCARQGQAEYVRFLNIAYASAREVEYQLSLARRLNYQVPPLLEDLAGEVCKVLRALIQSQSSNS